MYALITLLVAFIGLELVLSHLTAVEVKDAYMVGDLLVLQ